MNKKTRHFSLSLFFSLLACGFFLACDSDTNCYLDIKVLDADDNKPISGVNITIYQNNGGAIYREGVTSGNGVFSTRFAAPANVTVKAELPIIYWDSAYTPPEPIITGYRRGETTGRLIDGETVTRVIHLPPTIYP